MKKKKTKLKPRTQNLTVLEVLRFPGVFLVVMIICFAWISYYFLGPVLQKYIVITLGLPQNHVQIVTALVFLRKVLFLLFITQSEM